MNYKQTRSNSFKLSVQLQNVFTMVMTAHVRWPAKTSGAPDSYRDIFGCLFLCFFLLGKQKKEMERIFSFAKACAFLHQSLSRLFREQKEIEIAPCVTTSNQEEVETRRLEWKKR